MTGPRLRFLPAFLIALRYGGVLAISCDVFEKDCKCNLTEAEVRCQGGLKNDTSVLTRLPTWVKTLALTGYKFEVGLLPQIGNCREKMALTALDLSDNKITQIANDTFLCVGDLRTLTLNHNNWSIVGPYENYALSPLKNLRVLNLDHAFSGNVGCSADLEDCVRPLDTLDWYIPDIRQIHSLQNLSLVGNGIWTITSNFQQQIADLKQLQHFNLSDNEISFPRLKHGSESLKVFDLSNNAIPFLKKDFLTDLGKISTLKKIYLGTNPFKCICDMTDFLGWLQNNLSTVVQNRDSLTCFEGHGKVRPNTKLVQLNSTELSCGSYDRSGVYHPTVIVMAVLLTLVVLAVVTMLFLNRSSLKKLYKRLCDKPGTHDHEYLAVKT